MTDADQNRAPASEEAQWQGQPFRMGTPGWHRATLIIFALFSLSQFLIWYRDIVGWPALAVAIAAALYVVLLAAQPLLPHPRVRATSSTLRLPRMYRISAIPVASITDIRQGTGLQRGSTVVLCGSRQPVNTSLPADHQGIRQWWEQVRATRPERSVSPHEYPGMVDESARRPRRDGGGDTAGPAEERPGSTGQGGG